MPAAGDTCVGAIDLGGTKLAAAVVDADGCILSRHKEPARKASFQESLEQIASVMNRTAESAAVRSVGVIVPGIYNPRTGRAWAPNLWGQDEVPLGEELRSRLHVPVRIDSDRAGYVLGEQWLGVAGGLSDVVFLAVGTGIGAGILAGGRLVTGVAGIAGAVGWFALNPAMKDLYRQMGCWEAEAAGPAVARRGGAATAEEVVAAARAGEGRAGRAIAETVEYLAMGIANLVSILNPEMVVLGGGLMQASDLFLEPIRQAVPRWAQPIAVRQVRIEPTVLGEDAGLLGAARLALESLT